MLYVAEQPLTALLKCCMWLTATYSISNIYIYIYKNILIEQHTAAAAYVVLWLYIYIIMVKKLACLLRKTNNPRKPSTCFENMMFSFENIRINYSCRKYDFFVREYDFPQESYLFASDI